MECHMPLFHLHDREPEPDSRPLISLVLLSARLIATGRRCDRREREELQHLARTLYRSLPPCCKDAFLTHLRQKYLRPRDKRSAR